jgi:glycosyltransferase involved in cell wall biosynthesis
VAHDWLVGFRGGEAVLDRLLASLERAGRSAVLYNMFDDGRPLSPAIDRVRTPATLRVWPAGKTFAGPLRRWLLPLYPRAVEHLSDRLARDHAEHPFDLVVSTSSAAIKGLRPPPGVPHVCYCHAPARYLWSQTDAYTRGSAGLARGLGLRLFGARLRRWDHRSAANVTRFLANSTHTQGEIRRCFGRDSDVLFPPARTDFFTPPTSPARRAHWLYAGALEPYKRVDLALAAARLAGVELVVVGSGGQEAHLRRLASQLGARARFEGRVSDDALREHYRSARLLVFPQVEDFGITAVEAQACGLPVVALDAGGARDTVVDAVTGRRYAPSTPEALARAAAACPAPDDPRIRANALRFSEAAFDRALDELLKNPAARVDHIGPSSASSS